MINQSLRCPSCDQFGYIVSTEEADLEKFVATICHYCGHLLDRDGISECLTRCDAEGAAQTPVRIYQPPRRSPRRR
jgi:hypothetical protein